MSGCKKRLAAVISVGVGVPLFFAGAAVILKLYGFYPCPLYVISKALGCPILCPGCGAGRATLAILNLQFGKAFCYNPLYFIILPFLLYYILKLYIAFVTGRDILPFFNIGTRGGYIILAVIIVFTVIRNIPVSPFVYLNPNTFV